METKQHTYLLLHNVIQIHCRLGLAYEFVKMTEEEIFTIQAIIENSSEPVHKELYNDIQYPYFTDMLNQYVCLKNDLIRADKLPSEFIPPLVVFDFDSYYTTLRDLLLVSNEILNNTPRTHIKNLQNEIQRRIQKVKRWELERTDNPALENLIEIFINTRFKLISNFYLNDFTKYAVASNNYNTAKNYIEQMDSWKTENLVLEMYNNLTPAAQEKMKKLLK